jgi:hypothetical protein
MRPSPHVPAPSRAPVRPARAAALAGSAVAAVALAGAGCDFGPRGSSRDVRTASAVPLGGQSVLRIEFRTADVHLVASPDDTVRVVFLRHVQASTESAVDALLAQIKVTMERQGDQLVLRVREPERGRRNVSVQAGPWRYRRSVDVELTVAVPARARVETETMSGDLDAQGLRQAVSLISTSGDVELSQMAGETRVKSTSGDITLRDLSGPAVVQVTAGDVDAVGVGGPLTVRATSGDISAQQLRGGARLEASTGDIEAHDVSGTVFVSTSAGDVDVTGASSDSCLIETASGDISADLRSAPRLVQIRSSSGSVVLAIPPGSGGALDLQTASGSIQVRSAVEVETMNRNRLSGRLGGNGTVAVRTSSGDITLATAGGSAP